jgi:hypothetical protein
MCERAAVSQGSPAASIGAPVSERAVGPQRDALAAIGGADG